MILNSKSLKKSSSTILESPTFMNRKVC